MIPVCFQTSEYQGPHCWGVLPLWKLLTPQLRPGAGQRDRSSLSGWPRQAVSTRQRRHGPPFGPGVVRAHIRRGIYLEKDHYITVTSVGKCEACAAVHYLADNEMAL